MAKLYFRYGTMDSSKTANLIMVDYNYMEQGKHSIILKPVLDTRSGEGKVNSRLGISAKCIDISHDQSIWDTVLSIQATQPVDCILVDECQFLSAKHVEELARIVDEQNIPVIAYGLKNSYVKGQLFEGSEALLYYADSIEEIKTVCTFCKSKATMNLRISGGQPIYSGDMIQVGDIKSDEPEYYIPACRKHYFDPPLGQRFAEAPRCEIENRN